MQSGLAEQAAAISPSVAAQIETAAATGGTVEIPLSEYTARIAPTDLAQQLQPHLRTEADGFSQQEAQQHIEQEGAKYQEDFERAIGVAEQDDAFKASAQALRAQFVQQLTTAGQRSNVAEASAALMAAHYATRAAQLGMTPEQYYQRRPLKVAGAMVSGDQFDQAERSAATKAGDSWRAELARVSPGNMHFVPQIGTPAALFAMGQKTPKLGLPSRALLQIAQKHGDVPLAVVERLPELMHDPLFIIPHKDGGVTLVLDAQTDKGEPILVGVRDGKLRTVHAKNDRAGQTGQAAIARDVMAALATAGAKVYARNKEALVKTGASVLEPDGANSHKALSTFPKHKANITTRDDLVKRHGANYYQFAGQNAATADTHALATAQQRLEAGEDAEAVRQDTGWFKGKDGKWRFEINDKDAKLIGLRDDGNGKAHQYGDLVEVLDHPALFAALPACRWRSTGATRTTASDCSLALAGAKRRRAPSCPHSRAKNSTSSIRRGSTWIASGPRWPPRKSD